jgi:hypothetical protein
VQIFAAIYFFTMAFSVVKRLLTFALLATTAVATRVIRVTCGPPNPHHNIHDGKQNNCRYYNHLPIHNATFCLQSYPKSFKKACSLMFIFH